MLSGLGLTACDLDYVIGLHKPCEAWDVKSDIIAYISIRSLRSFDNFLFKFNVSFPLVTGELLQNMVDVNNVTYKLYNIKI